MPGNTLFFCLEKRKYLFLKVPGAEELLMRWSIGAWVRCSPRSHTASKWQSQDPNLGQPDPKDTVTQPVSLPHYREEGTREEK